MQPTPGEAQTRFDGAGFLTAAAGSAIVLFAVSAVTSGGISAGTLALLAGGILLLYAFVTIELWRIRRGREPLLDLRRFRDRTFSFSGLANVFVAFARFGTLFLMPIYLQTVHGRTVLETGMILAMQAVATAIALPIGGRLSDRIGPRPVVITGLIMLAGTTALMMTLALNTPIWMIVGILILLGAAFGLTRQIQVSAMSRIEKDERKEIANASTILSVLHATAAPMGVALLASLVEVRSRQYAIDLAAQGVTGPLLEQQSTVLAMHTSFLVASCFALAALAAMSFVPKPSMDAKRANGRDV